MLIPRPVHIQYRKTETAKTRQLNMKSPATAPKWNNVMTLKVAQFTR